MTWPRQMPNPPSRPSSSCWRASETASRTTPPSWRSACPLIGSDRSPATSRALCVLLGPAEHEAERMTNGISEDAEAGLFPAVQSACSQRQDLALRRVDILDPDV